MCRPFHVPFSWGRLPLLPILGIFLNAFMLAQLTWPVIAIGLGLMILGGLAAMLNRRSSVQSLKTIPEKLSNK
jgi:hypothetical protein